MNKHLQTLAAAALLSLVAVGAQAATIVGRYTVFSNGAEVKDNTTGLIWRTCPEGMTVSLSQCIGEAWTFSPMDALALSESDITGVAWRVPNVKELASISDSGFDMPTIDGSVFPNTPVSYFWTSTPFAVAKQTPYWGFWVVNFTHGGVTAQGHNAMLPVRLFRGGRP